MTTQLDQFGESLLGEFNRLRKPSDLKTRYVVQIAMALILDYFVEQMFLRSFERLALLNNEA